ncbi:MAG TPA: hypothetical protein VE999_18665 [Gemmataceae bacterium]|nr:hypothetical protein [Gemmataceae bacterium]
MTSFDLNFYASAIAELLREPHMPPLDAGTPNRKARSRLEGLANDAAFAPHRVRDRGMADACRAGLWLYHNFLDEAHTIAQNLPTPTGSYWHALMHRRELDFDNAKYWFRRVGVHPIYEPLRQDAAELADNAPAAAAFLRTQSTWDPFAFVDLCAASLAGRAPCEELCRQIQKREWELLFDWCYRQAVEEAGD